MNRTLARWLVSAYPAAWRERYGEEFEELLRAGASDPRTILDVLRSALSERWSQPRHGGLVMSGRPESLLWLSKQPSAFLPMAMSIAALTVVLVELARFGLPPAHADEGAAAHTWQLLMVCQALGVAWFAFKWLRKAPRLTLGILGVQLALSLAAMAPVYILGL